MMALCPKGHEKTGSRNRCLVCQREKYRLEYEARKTAKCKDCGAPVNPGRKTGRCRPCVARFLARDPATRAKTAVSMSRVWSDPAYKDRLSRKISAAQIASMAENQKLMRARRELGRKLALTGKGLAAQRADPNYPRRLAEAISDSKLSWCPREYRDHYRFLLRQKRFCAATAKEMILAKVEQDRRAAIAATSLNDAIHFLRRFAPIATRQDGYLYGTVILSAEELIARAEQKGWQPDRWAA
jgi:hypothetical protein